MFCGRRPVEPWKMTSSIRAPRRTRGLCSPKTQRTASEMFDFPQPLGPITAVTPGSTSTSTLSANDLNPASSRRRSLMDGTLCAAQLPALPVEVSRLSRYAAWSGES